jgi:hypothetical protein
MATAIVTGALTPLGYQLVAELAAQDIPVIAHVQVPATELEGIKARFPFPKVRVDNTPWSAMTIMQFVNGMRPTHIISALPATAERVVSLKLRGIPEGNWEEDHFKYTDMLVDAVVKSQHEARIVYLSRAGASRVASDPARQAMGRAEQKITFGSLPYTVVHAPPVDELGWGGLQMPFKLMRSTKDMFWSLAGLANGDLRRRNKTIDPRFLARTVIDHAFSEAAENAVLEPKDLR